MKKIGVITVIFLWVALTAFAWFAPSKDMSQSERRPLKQFPEISVEDVLKGSFMEKFEGYALDQFPLRDNFRTLKSLFSYKLLGKIDNNGIYIADGYAAKLEYPLNAASVNNALKKFDYIYTTYLQNTDCKIYSVVIPDKGYYLAPPKGYPTMDYSQLFNQMAKGMPWAKQVDITGSLSVTDYYRTDTHWRQEKLLDTANILCDAMGIFRPEGYTPTLVSQEFRGVYYGQAALPMGEEEIYVMENPALADCRVYNYETGKYCSIYDLEKLSGNDPYDVYLSGAQALLRIENPNAKTERELVIFRDSFGSALAPLLLQDYKTVTLVDIRYVSSQLLSNFLTFQNQDVLFAYSTLILNNSATLK
ncbi:MAG: hypothetical protein IKY18_06665 [Oscillospiraceae bacterium]|nr:hypothetical protein [Oscillospiraceae bacterium]